MNHTQNYITQQSETCRKEWFKEHKAELAYLASDLANGIKLINWQNPKSWNYGCRFIVHRRWLCVVGDIGEATFEWSSDITLEFLAQIDFGYFLSKCRASPEGLKFEDFDNRIAELHRVDRVAELKSIPEDDHHEDYDEELQVLEEISGGWKDEYDAAARDYYDATGDAETAGDISGMGVVPSVHAIGMFVGLQMAIAQLKGNA